MSEIIEGIISFILGYNLTSLCFGLKDGNIRIVIDNIITIIAILLIMILKE